MSLFRFHAMRAAQSRPVPCLKKPSLGREVKEKEEEEEGVVSSEVNRLPPAVNYVGRVIWHQGVHQVLLEVHVFSWQLAR